MAKPAAGDFALHLALDNAVNGASNGRRTAAEYSAAAEVLAKAYPPAAAEVGARGKRPFELASEFGADPNLTEMLFALADLGDGGGDGSPLPGQLQPQPPRPTAAGPSGTAEPGGAADSAASEEERRLAAALRMAKARRTGLEEELRAWKAEVASREEASAAGVAAAQARAEEEVEGWGQELEDLQERAEGLAEEVEVWREALEDRDDQIGEPAPSRCQPSANILASDSH